MSPRGRARGSPGPTLNAAEQRLHRREDLIAVQALAQNPF
jgi:hypothetical protein